MDRDSKKPGGALPAPREVQVNAAAVTSFAPGFRFHPTDEELISYYLKRKVQGKPMRLDAIGEVDFYKHEPWNLPEHSKLKTRDKEWIFFSALDKKYSTGTSVKRATKEGYWHITGKDKEIRRGDGEASIGMMKIFVFYKGRAPRGRRTNWVMHEYRLAENDECLKVDAYVLCKVFRKQNPGEPIESRYAPFLEQEWDDDDGERAVSPVPVVVDANRINEIQQIDDNNKEHDDDKALKRAQLLHCDLDKDAPLPFCVLNKQAPLPLVQYKRKRRVNDSSGNSNSSRQMTQGHCSSTATIVDAEPEPLTISEQCALSVLESCLGDMIEDLGNKQEPVAEKVPASSLTKSIQDLVKEKEELVVLRETQMRETVEAEILINYLEDQIKTLSKENEELRKNKSNKGQCS